MALKKHRRLQGASIKLSPQEREKLEHWEDGVEKIAKKISAAEASNDPRLSEKPRSVLKRGVYALINELHGNRHSMLEAALVSIVNKPLQVRFEDNPYHWGLAAVSASGETSLNFHASISEFAIELHYARSHRIPEELLIGFIHQVGGSKRIRERIDQRPFEDWFHPGLPWLRDDKF